MSGNIPRVAGGTTLGAVATQLPNTGAGDIVIQLAAFVAGFVVVWLVADLVSARK